MPTTEPDTPSRPVESWRMPTRSRPVLGLLGLVGVACAVTGAAAVAGFFGQLWWLFDLCSHFRTQYAVVLSLGLLAFSLARHRAGAVVLLLLWLLNLATMLPLWLGDDGEPESPPAGERQA